MSPTLRLDRMTTSDKLRTLERIWDDLSRSPENVPSPSWHADELRNREKRVKKGLSQFIDWGEAKRNIRKSVK